MQRQSMLSFSSHERETGFFLAIERRKTRVRTNPSGVRYRAPSMCRAASGNRCEGPDFDDSFHCRRRSTYLNVWSVKVFNSNDKTPKTGG